jgi:hypothetical protein
MIGTLITSQTRIKLLKKFFLNSSTKAYLRGLESEFGDSTNAIRIELNRFEQAGLLTSSQEFNKKYYQANTKHPLFNDIHNIVIKETGLDKVIEKVIHRMGTLTTIYLTGDFAKGRDGSIIELVLVGEQIDSEYLSRKIVQAEELVGRKLNCIVLDPIEAEDYLSKFDPTEFLPLWTKKDNTV